MIRFSRALLIIIALGSFGLRVWGIQFGLPFAYHPDEQQYILPGIGVVSGNFEPWAYYNPTLYPYLIGLVYTATYWGLRAFHAFPDFFSLDTGWSEPMLPWVTGLIYLARYTGAAAGVLTTLVIYRVGRRAYGATTGLAAAIIFGLTFLPAREAHFAVSDAPVALGVAATLYFCLGIVGRGAWPDYLWAGVALGLSAATKYSAGLLLLPVVAAHVLSRNYSTWRQRILNSWALVVVGLVAALSFLAVSPYTVIAWDEFVADFGENLESARNGFQGLELDPAGGALFYLKTLLWGFGWPLFLLFLVAILFMLGRRRRVDIILLILPLFGFWYMQRQAMYFARWFMPFLPPLALIAAETARVGSAWLLAQIQHHSHISTLQENQTQRRKDARTQGYLLIFAPLNLCAFALNLFDQRWFMRLSQLSPHGVAVGLVLLLALPSTYVAMRANHIFSQPDTRTEALRWIQQNIPPGSIIAAEVLSPPWGPPLAMPGLHSNSYRLAPVPDGGVAEVDVRQLRDWQVQYVVASSYHYARPLLDKTHQAKLAAHLHALDEQADLLIEFQPYFTRYAGFFYHDQVYGPANDTLYRRQPGPVIRIYRLR
jgi:4-amino-4-deoxy-L-arabinose transferase-like glycosyltransferase